jgi:adenylyltransferase/sulfurtransferase
LNTNHLDCTPEELNQKRERGDDFLLLDVRTRRELDLASIDKALHIPMDELEERLSELESMRDKEIVVMCHLGMRSAAVQEFLIEIGFPRVRNLVGGIEAYAARIDPNVGRY